MNAERPWIKVVLSLLPITGSVGILAAIADLREPLRAYAFLLSGLQIFVGMCTWLFLLDRMEVRGVLHLLLFLMIIPLTAFLTFVSIVAAGYGFVLILEGLT